MDLMDNKLYRKEIDEINNLPLAWEKLANKVIMISGATGTVGRMLIDVIMAKNKNGLNCCIIALGRNQNKAKEIFGQYFGNSHFIFECADINLPLCFAYQVDYILHMASNTHPMQYSSDPVGTITTNIIGTYNLLEYAIKYNCQRFLFLSSVEIYGECQNNEDFNEMSLGFINCNTLRAGYPESKRVGESLCQAYISKYKLEVVIPRLARVYGPTITPDDSKAVSQFFKKALVGENIILKSEGKQFYSYCYIGDAVSSILFLLFEGKNGEAYNVASLDSDISLKNLAEKIAESADLKVEFDLPNEIERKGFSTATRAILDCRKVHGLGWESKTDIEAGIKKTLDILRDK